MEDAPGGGDTAPAADPLPAELDLWAGLMLRWMGQLPEPTPEIPPLDPAPPSPEEEPPGDWWLVG